MSELLARRPGLLALVDPGRTDPAAAGRQASAAAEAGVAGILIGGSFDGTQETHRVAAAVRTAAPGLPVVLFPGSAMQLTDQVDLILFLSLVSGRNPQYLIEEHVRAVPFLQRHPVPTLSTAYILVDGGRVTSVEAVSQTRPLPADKPELAAAHARAARLIGMRAVFLDAGSGAEHPVPPAVIAACRNGLDDPSVPLFVGGGIRSPQAAAAARAAGADFVVVGTVLEQSSGQPLAAFVRAVREGRA
ncbi:MAG: geranylgeranylglyceryl/heptaprenylglyceryl phosphate synthase [Gemmatimonadales bacterium]